MIVMLMNKVYKFIFFLKRKKSKKITKLSVYGYTLKDANKILDKFLKKKNHYFELVKIGRLEDADLKNKYFSRFENIELAIARQHQVVKELII